MKSPTIAARLGIDSSADGPGAASAPFDATAEHYDDHFTRSRLGRWLRARVWARLDASFVAGDRVLELGSGTGEDALHLVQRGVAVTLVDQSTTMLQIAERKLRAARSQIPGSSADVALVRADFNEARFWRLVDAADREGVETAPEDRVRWSGAFSNFGAVNCMRDRPNLFAELGARLPPGSPLVLVVMGPLCPVESASFALRGRWRDVLRRRRATARVRQGGVGSAEIAIQFPSAGRLARELSPWFVERRRHGLGAVLPTTEMAAFVDRHPRLFGALCRAESLAAPTLGRWAADHYLLELERR